MAVEIRRYRPGDEGPILELFREVFRVERSLEHWRWKFQDDPWGRERISTGWVDGELAAHYSGYPVPFYLNGLEKVVYQVGDTMTNPRFRHIGRRRTNLLVRTADHFYSRFCQGKIPFFYGFNTGKIHKFGRLFLRYEPVVPVEVWRVAVEELPPPSRLKGWLCGYRVQRVEQVPREVDELFRRVAHRYGFLTARTAVYLNWRYCDCPDQDYRCYLVRRRGRCVGFWVLKLQGRGLLIGDALFEDLGAARWSLSVLTRELIGQGMELEHLKGWFGEWPPWWAELLKDMGFRREPEEHGLKMVVIRFEEEPTPERLARSLYYTWGDSDLF